MLGLLQSRLARVQADAKAKAKSKSKSKGGNRPPRRSGRRRDGSKGKRPAAVAA